MNMFADANVVSLADRKDTTHSSKTSDVEKSSNPTPGVFRADCALGSMHRHSFSTLPVSSVLELLSDLVETFEVENDSIALATKRSVRASLDRIGERITTQKQVVQERIEAIQIEKDSLGAEKGARLSLRHVLHSRKVNKRIKVLSANASKHHIAGRIIETEVEKYRASLMCNYRIIDSARLENSTRKVKVLRNLDMQLTSIEKTIPKASKKSLVAERDLRNSDLKFRMKQLRKKFPIEATKHSTALAAGIFAVPMVENFSGAGLSVANTLAALPLSAVVAATILIGLETLHKKLKKDYQVNQTQILKSAAKTACMVSAIKVAFLFESFINAFGGGSTFLNTPFKQGLAVAVFAGFVDAGFSSLVTLSDEVSSTMRELYGRKRDSTTISESLESNSEVFLDFIKDLRSKEGRNKINEFFHSKGINSKSLACFVATEFATGAVFGIAFAYLSSMKMHAKHWLKDFFISGSCQATNWSRKVVAKFSQSFFISPDERQKTLYQRIKNLAQKARNCVENIIETLWQI